MFVTFDVLNPLTSSDASDAQPENMLPMFVAERVSMSPTFNDSMDLQL